MDTDEIVQPEEELEADGYYGDDEADGEELDLSFLRDEDDEEERGVK
jgi:hypothetical protein